MYNYGELELLVLSCIWLEPKLLETTKLEEKHFINNRKIFIFFKSFYKKFGFFDTELMCRKVDDRYKFRDYFKIIANLEPTPRHFKMYESLLLELYNEAVEEKYLREKIYGLATDLYLKNMTSKEFKERIDNLYTHSKEICEND